MKFKKFSIKGYRAIKETDVLFNQNQLIPLIGINESGKTSILHAILAFDKSKDKTNNSIHLEYKNKYIIRKGECLITAHIYLESIEEAEALLSDINIKENDFNSMKLILESMISEKKCFEIERNLENKKYCLRNTAIPESYENKFIKYFTKNLPFILYFDDFSDRVPARIDFKKDYAGEGSIKGISQAAEWNRIIEEVFKRSGYGYSLKEFLGIQDGDDREGLLSDVGDVLNKEIMHEWKEFKKIIGPEDNETNLALKLDFTEWDEDYGYSFKFKVIDKTQGQSRQFDIVERSKGFQWFFNFILKLKFNPKYTTNPSGAIYLLDEPGSYLHASAQEELLKKLKNISQTNVIFFCTHSQHLLNPDVVNISSIKIADKKDGVVDLKNFSSTRITKSQGALTPLFDALKTSLQIIENSYDRIILTEGITDYYFLKMLDQYTDEISLENIHIIPGAGADQLKELISLIVSKTDLFYIFFDNDKAGRNASDRYEKYFHGWILEHCVFYGDKSRDFVLEDYIVQDDKDKLLSITKCKDVKAAIIQIYFLKDSLKKSFFSSLTEDSVYGLKGISLKIDKLSKAKNRNELMLPN